MKISVLLSVVLLLAAGSIFVNNSAQSAADSPRAVAMTGDKEAVWIATVDDELIYCWWPDSPARLDKQAQCRVLNRYRVDRIQ